MAVFEETRGSMRLEIRRDENPESPRNTENNLGKMICFHRHYSFGDEHNYSAPADFIRERLNKMFDSDEEAENFVQRLGDKPEKTMLSMLHMENVIP